MTLIRKTRLQGGAGRYLECWLTEFAEEVRAALAVADDETAGPVERAEMLMEIALGLQQRPKNAEQLHAAVELYDKALAVCPKSQELLRARITARKGTALQAVPEEGTECLDRAGADFDTAIPILMRLGTPEEVAEAEMNHGVVVQALAGAGRARITDAISAYQRALRTFNGAKHPKEFAILQNNLATAFLSMPFTDERSKMREALAVQAFEEGLKVVDHYRPPVRIRDAAEQSRQRAAIRLLQPRHREQSPRP